MQTTQRKSFTAINNIYFWTATIHNWHHLLQSDKMEKKVPKEAFLNLLHIPLKRN
jgi:hypothetical protein